MAEDSFPARGADSPLARRYWFIALGGILLFSLFLRWPMPAPEWRHVDERAFILYPLGFWSGDLNPHFFNYPTFQFYLTSLVYYVYYLLFHGEPVEHFVAYRYFVGGDDLIAIARLLHALMSVATVAVTAHLGRRLYGYLGGLLAGVVLATMPLSVRFAHLAITDTPAVLWISLALLGGVRVRQDGRTGDFLLAGVFVGLAGATKYPAALVGVPVAVAALLRKPSLKQMGIWLAGGAAVLVFAAAAPYVWLDAAGAWADFSAMGQEHLFSGSHGTEASWLYHLRYSLRYGLGLVGLLTAFVALLWKPRQWKHEEFIVVSGIVAFFLLLVLAESVFIRYALPLAPLLAVLVVRPLLGLCRNRVILLVGCLVLLAEPMSASLQTRSLLAGEDTRAQAVRWIEENAGPGSILISLSSGAGKVQVVYPGYVYIRQNRFFKSYGMEEVKRVYARLSQRRDLPPLYLSLTAEAIEDDIASGAEKAGSWAILLDYQHPLCSPERSEKEKRLLELCDWQGEFSPGQIETTVFDGVDWYFVPIGGFGGIERTGPRIRLGKVPLRVQKQKGTLQDFFRLLHAILRGREEIKKEHWTKAIALYTEAMQVPLPLDMVLTPVYMRDLYSSMGLAYSRLENFEAAVPYWERAVLLDGTRAEDYNNLGVSYAKLGREDQAIAAWVKAVELKPEYDSAYFNLGNARYRRKEFERAMAAWEKTLELNPGYTKVLYNLGNAYYQLENWTKSMEFYQRAAEVQPGRADIFYNIGQVQLKMGQVEAAIQSFERVLELAPEDVDAHIQLGNLHSRSGRNEEARACFRKVLELVPDHPQADQIRQFLESVR